MSTDWYTKLVLTVLAVCAALLVARDFQGGAAGAASEEGRYRLQVMPMGRMMLKIDSETGKTWRANFPDPKAWLPIADEPVETLDEATPEKGEGQAEAPEAQAPAAADPMAQGTP